MSTTTNQFELEARSLKASKIAQLFIDKGIDADVSLVGAFHEIKTIRADEDPFRGFPKDGDFE